MDDSKVKDEVLSDWRKTHWFDAMERGRKAMEAILKNKTSTNREKIDAAKALARMVSGLQPEKVIQTAKDKKKTPLETGVLPDKDVKEIEGLAKGDW